jgi:hypothetical protein
MRVDLATRPGAITPWPPHGCDPALTEEQVANYWRDGYLIGIPVLNQAEVARVNLEIDEVSDPSHEGREYWYEYNADSSETAGIIHGIGGWRVREGLHDLLWHPKICLAFRQILQTQPRLLFDQLFCKPAHHSKSVAWHQDYSYWTYSQPMNHVTCWIALEDADIGNGCVQYVPRSHRWNALLPRPSGLTRGAEPLLSALTPEQREQFVPVAAELEAGSVIFHHPLTIHGSLPNTSPRSRRGTTVHAMADGTRAVVDAPTIQGIPGWLLGGAGPFYPLIDKPVGPVLDGPFFPVL